MCQDDTLEMDLCSFKCVKCDKIFFGIETAKFQLGMYWYDTGFVSPFEPKKPSYLAQLFLFHAEVRV